ncbi:MAG TPA: tetratricopeptide repeat protein [Gemmatimonadaceae bacterium]|nr:tetratricopeptide repeat protein [Gemmatimonadaceae bacterium]
MTAEPSPSRDPNAPVTPSRSEDGYEHPSAGLPPLADATAPLPEDPAEQAFSLLLQGELKFRHRNLLEAESCLRRAVDLHARLPDVDPSERLRALDSLGAVYVSRGDLARAEPILRETLVAAEILLGDDHEDLGPYLNQLALVQFKRRRYADAEPVLARLVSIKRRLGDEHPEVASVVANLAMVHEALQRYDSAETLWRCALAIRERSLPGDSPAVSMAREHLADMCAANGRPEEAIGLRELALAARSRTLPADHPQVVAGKAKLTALRVEGVRARIPVVVPQARTPERHAATPQKPIPRPPARGAPARAATPTPPLPREVLDEIVRVTQQTPAKGVMAGMRGRARQLFERPLLQLVKPRADAPPDEPALDEDEDFEPSAAASAGRVAAPRPATPRPATPRPVPPIVRPRLADPVPTTWDEADALTGREPDDGDDDLDPPSRFDLFGDALWPRTRMVLAVLALTLVLAVAAAGVARIAGGASAADSSATAQGTSGAAAGAATTEPAAEAAVSERTMRVMDAGINAMRRASSQ